MISDNVTGLGVGGIFALLIIREVFAFVRSKKLVQTGAFVAQVDWKKLESQVDLLYKWHDVNDSEGVKLWYIRRSLEEAITKLSSNIDMQTKVLQKMLSESHDVRKDISLVREDLRRVINK